MDLGVEVSDYSGVPVLVVSGQLDFATGPELRGKLAELTAAGYQRVVVNLDGLAFIDSSGLSVLVGGLNRLRAQDGNLLLVCTQRRLLGIFEITGLIRVFAVHSSIEAALGSGAVPDAEKG